MKLQSLINTSINFLRFLISGQVKIYSFQGIKSSLSEKYLKRLPNIGDKDVVLYINNTHLIFHEDGGLSIDNKYNIISSEVLVFDHREGYCEPVNLIEPFTECDKDLQPNVIVKKYFTLK